YGLGNIAGNVNIHTKNGGDRTQVRLLTGSFNTFDGSLLTSEERDGFSQTYFVGYRQTDGYRDHSDLKKGAASGKWFYTPDDGPLTVGLIARFFGIDANAPGYLTESMAENDPEQAASFARTDGGIQENRHVSLHADYKLSPTVNVSLKTYAQELERTRWCRWSDAGSQQERYSDDEQYGAVSTLSYVVEDLGIDRLKVDWGLDVQYQDNADQRWTTADRVRQGGPVRDWDLTQSYWGSYVQADGTINPWLRLVGALRVDRFDGDMKNVLTGTRSDMLDMDLIWQPKAGFILTPERGYSVYANWGRTFQIPGSPQLFGQDTSGNEISRSLSESINDGWEAGLKVSPFAWLSSRLDYWELVSTDEVRNKGDGSGDYINTGETHRKGWDIALTVKPHRLFAVWGSYSRVQAEYTDPGPGLNDRRGKDIENIPDYTAKLGVDVDHPSGITASLWLESQGKYHVDPQNIKPEVGDYDVWNMSLGYTTGRTTFGIEVKNLLDETYNAFVWDSEYGFSPGDERSLYAWVMLEY
ncbi:TonB-dependent receptor, partial [Desulfatiferula olefinivorans]